ncbi:MAG: DUF3786 domain-containing protein [Proteobacteria bacterium]|nr:DUF3786 domain-containing protein [Pseudomonadota bacterium]
MPQLKNTMDILKLLNKSNCRECYEKTCLAFAASVFKGQKQLNECPHLDPGVIDAYGGTVEKRRTIEEDQEEILLYLKNQVIEKDLGLAAKNIGGSFSKNRLTLKIFGKDFSIDTSGKLSSDIHVNPWVTIPFLSHILTSDGTAVTGKWVPFRELKDGQSWQGLFGQRCEKPLKKIADTYTDIFEDLIHIFNGKKVDRHYQSDISLVLHPFPQVPLLICYWKPEDGLESDLNLFFDQSIEHHLSIEGVFGLGTGLVRMFEKIAIRHGSGIAI